MYHPRLFPGLGPIPPVPPTPPPPTMSPRSNRAVYDDIAQRLMDTGVFDRVVEASPEDLENVPASDGLVAIITPDVSVEDEPQALAWEQLRTVECAITLKGQSMNLDEAYEALDRSAAYAQVALNGASLGGFTLRDRTVVRRGRYDSRDAPNVMLGLAVSFTYVYDVRTGPDKEH
jgi:hypothetical protein